MIIFPSIRGGGGDGGMGVGSKGCSRIGAEEEPASVETKL
jgi:hypothetical protein